MKVRLGTMKDFGEELASFLEPRVGAKPELSGGAIEIQDDAVRKGIKPRHIKTYIKRFMFQKGVRKKYRVFVAGKELTIQEIEIGKKGEEKAEEEEKAAKSAEETPKEEKTEEEPAKEEASEKEEPEKKEEKAKKAPRKTKAKKKAQPEKE